MDMEKSLIKEINKISKFIITKDISFIGYEYGNSLFVFMKIEDIDIHLEIFLDDISILNCFNSDKNLLNFSGTTEECLNQINFLILNKELTYEERVKWFYSNYYETGMEYDNLIKTMLNDDLDNLKWYDDFIKIPKYRKDLK